MQQAPSLYEGDAFYDGSLGLSRSSCRNAIEPSSLNFNAMIHAGVQNLPRKANTFPVAMR